MTAFKKPGGALGRLSTASSPSGGGSSSFGIATFVGVQTAIVGDSRTLPALEIGDIIFAYVGNTGATDPSLVTSGYTLYTSYRTVAGGTGRTVNFYWKFADGTETSVTATAGYDVFNVFVMRGTRPPIQHWTGSATGGSFTDISFSGRTIGSTLIAVGSASSVVVTDASEPVFNPISNQQNLWLVPAFTEDTSGTARFTQGGSGSARAFLLIEAPRK